MAKYHVKKDGSPGLCKAKINCPLGGEHEHFDTLEKAQEYADYLNHRETSTINFINKLRSELPTLYSILEEVEAKGGKSYFVGGFVRDFFLGKESKDIDIEFHQISPEELTKLIEKKNLKVDLVGKAFGVLKSDIDGEDLDLSFPRTEKLIGTKHTDFEVVVDPYIGLDKATERRDFTIGAIMLDTQTGEIVDKHSGIKDLENGIIRHVSDKFSEDPLRVMRAAQFASRFDFEIAKETVDISKNISLDELPYDRVHEEFKKAMTKSNKPSIFFKKLKEMNQTSRFSFLKNDSEEDFNRKMKELDELSKIKGEFKNYIPAVVQIISDGEDFTEIDRSVDTKRFINKNPLEYSNKIENFVKENKTEELLMTIENSSEDILTLAKVKSDYLKNYDFTETLNKHKESKKEFLSGKDLISLGFKPGPEFLEKINRSKELAFKGMKKEEIIEIIKKN